MKSTEMWHKECPSAYSFKMNEAKRLKAIQKARFDYAINGQETSSTLINNLNKK